VCYWSVSSVSLNLIRVFSVYVSGQCGFWSVSGSQYLLLFCKYLCLFFWGMYFMLILSVAHLVLLLSSYYYYV
jgi:hypothetical protein